MRLAFARGLRASLANSPALCLGCRNRVRKYAIRIGKNDLARDHRWGIRRIQL